jgi:uncharacterized lipoprotein YajG
MLQKSTRTVWRTLEVGMLYFWRESMKRFLAALTLILLCSGCALTTAQIDVPYQPAAGATVGISNAAALSVAVTTTDGRTTYRDRVSSKKNGYGMEMAAIVASNDLPTSISEAFRQELSARGFKMGPQGAIVQVELARFYNDFKTGFFSGDAVANVSFNVKVLSPAGGIAFAKLYEGNGTEPNIQMAGGDNARAALIKAFSASVNSVVNDPDFIRALLEAGGQAPKPMAMLHLGS